MKKLSALLVILALVISSIALPASAGAAPRFKVKAKAVRVTKAGASVAVKFKAKSTRKAYVRVHIYKNGKCIRTIRSKGRVKAKTLSWNLKTNTGAAVSSGTYTYKVRATSAGVTVKTTGKVNVKRRNTTTTTDTTTTTTTVVTEPVAPAPTEPTSGSVVVDTTATAEPVAQVDPVVTEPVAVPVVPVVKTQPATVSSRWFGYYVPGAPASMDPLNALQDTVGAKARVVNFFIADTESFPEGRVSNVANNGSIPMVTMEFWSTQTGGVSTITNGNKDAYLRTWARAAKSYGGEIWLRPFHEMNGNWYPWGGTMTGNTAADVVAAWKHVHDVFVAEGATNVKFVWCVNNDTVPDTTANAVEKYWPGDAYVDYLSIDGYNWGTTKSWSSWRSFSSVFGAAYGRVTKLSAKPLFIGETGCAEQGGDKAAWIKDAYAKISSTYTRIEGVCWFNANKEADWRVESSASSLEAYKTVLKAGY